MHVFEPSSLFGLLVMPWENDYPKLTPIQFMLVILLNPLTRKAHQIFIQPFLKYIAFDLCHCSVLFRVSLLSLTTLIFLWFLPFCHATKISSTPSLEENFPMSNQANDSQSPIMLPKNQALMHPKRQSGRLHARQPTWQSPHEFNHVSQPFNLVKHLFPLKSTNHLKPWRK